MFWSGSGKFLAPVWGGRWNQLWISDGLLSLICLWHAQCFRDKGATGQNINSWYQFMRLANADYLRNSLSREFSPLPPRRWVSAWWSTKPHKIWRTMDCALHTSTMHTLFFFTVWKDWASQEADDNLALARYVLKRSRRNEGTRSAPQFCDWLEKNTSLCQSSVHHISHCMAQPVRSGYKCMEELKCLVRELTDYRSLAAQWLAIRNQYLASLEKNTFFTQ